MKNETIWILGPCAVESEEVYINTAKHLYEFMGNRDWYYKSSFDKANRTSVDGERGLGLDASIALFKEVKQIFPNIKLTTDVHEVWQVENLIGIVDAIQIPAFLCRQTDLIVECAKYFEIVNIKKGQWIGPNNLAKSIDKIKNTNADCEAWITDRGSNFGYDKLIVDFTIVEELKRYYDKVILDCTHSVQRSKVVYGIQGDRKLAEKYLLSSIIFEYDGAFAEVHPYPSEAISDSDCQIFLKKVKSLIEKHEAIGKVLNESV